MNILLIGRGSVLAACAEVLRTKGVAFSVIEPAEQELTTAFAGSRLSAPGVTVHTRCAAETLEYIRTAPRPLLIFSIVNSVLFPPEITECEDITIINYHNSLLPGHRGRHCEAWQIFHQEAFAGVTWHYVDSGVDTGAVIRQSAIPLSPEMTSIRLLAMQGREAVRLFREMLPEVLRAAERGEKAACAAGSGSLSKTGPGPMHYSWEKPNGGVLNPAWPADKVWAFLHAMDYGCLHTLGVPVLDWEGVRYTWQRYAGEGELRGLAGGGTCLTGSVMTFVYPAGRIVLRGCGPRKQEPASAG